MSFKDFFRPQWKNSNPVKRLEAIPQLNDQNILKDIFLNDPSTQVKKAALIKIDDQLFLESIVDKTMPTELLKLILSKIKNPNFISELILNEKYAPEIRVFSLEMLNDQNLISKIIVKQNEDELLKQKAISLLSNDHIIARLLNEENIEENLVWRLIIRIENQNVLYKMLETQTNDNVRKILFSRIKNKERLKDSNYLTIEEKAILFGSNEFTSQNETVSSTEPDTKNKENEELMEAVFENDLNRIKILLENGANPNIKHESFSSLTPLKLASLRGYTKIVKLLLNKNADPNFPVDENYSPLKDASEQGHLEIVQQLINHGAKINDSIINMINGFLTKYASMHSQNELEKYKKIKDILESK